jgi:heme exporter protein B
MIRSARTIFRKDLTIERRSTEITVSVLLFSALAVVIFAIGFYVDETNAQIYGPGVIWVVLLFASTLALNRLFDTERENDCLGGLLLTPADPRGLYLGKAVFHWLMTLGAAIVTVPAIFMFFDMFRLIGSDAALVLAASLVLGLSAFSLVGTLFAAMLLHTRLREVLLPIVVYPLVTPVLIAGVQITRELLSGAPVAEVMGWFYQLVAFDLFFLAGCLVLFPIMVRAR